MAELRVNDKIKAQEVRVVAPDGSQIGVKTKEEALWLANQLDMDLVEVAPEAKPPVCRLMDYGKFRYEQSVKNRESRKNQVKTVIKEVKYRPKIDDHDFDTKNKKAVSFLMEGHKVKVTMMFRGREVTHPEFGRALLDRMVAELEGIAVVETPPSLEGRNMTMLLAPDPKAKARRKAAARAANDEAAAEQAAAEHESADEELSAGEPVDEVSVDGDAAVIEAEPVEG
ncbi:MAG: translation initiation factor IF-3 [Acidimicrobiia bacterium]|nr:translation initiation factor IF-3 [Acidimicrobiia bacterium]